MLIKIQMKMIAVMFTNYDGDYRYNDQDVDNNDYS